MEFLGFRGHSMSENKISPSLSDVVLVTVTYGNRLLYLKELLEKSFNVEGIGNAIVVSNNSSSPLEQLEAQWGEKIKIIRLDSNTGSANGYAVGISEALALDAEYIWLMDDDNVPKAGAVASLLDGLLIQSTAFPGRMIAVAGFREDHQADIAQGVEKKFAIPPRSSFFGFHFSHIHYKIIRRLPFYKNKKNEINSVIEIPYAPYGGLLAHKKIFCEIGLPKISLLLYADDTEYTFRITNSGGKIFLLKNAVLDDLEGSWNLKSKANNVFHGFLIGESDFRAYYSARNQVWFDRNCWSNNSFVYYLNAFIFIFLLLFFSIKYKKLSRFKLLCSAIWDGLKGRLGQKSEFVL